jgi:leucyl aminopeptidase
MTPNRKPWDPRPISERATLSVTLTEHDHADLSAPMCAIALAQGAAPQGLALKVDEMLGGAIRGAIASREFLGARDEIFFLSGPAKGPRRIALIGLGTAADEHVSLKRAAALAARTAAKAGSERLLFVATTTSAHSAQYIAIGLFAGAWQYADLKTPPPDAERRAPLAAASIAISAFPGNKASVDAGIAVGIGQSLTRTLGMMPGNLCTPDYLAATARDIAERHGMSATVLGRAELEAEGMGAMLAVAQGTPQDPKLMVLEYRGGAADAKPVVLVGKGLCFDSGGISIKPAQNMESMKFDMSGGGAVLGAMEAIGRIKPVVNVVGIVGATTNMPSGTAVKPGDVVRSHSGRFIEIINTDAEGRLVLADLLSYASRFQPAAVIDAATLTGAVVVALGHVASGLFSTDAALIAELAQAGKRAGEPSWELPLWEDYRDSIKSDVADVMNSGGRAASSITAALFLKDFAVGYPWVHMDVAGTAYSESDLVFLPKGPTGVPVCTFVEFVRARAG